MRVLIFGVSMVLLAAAAFGISPEILRVVPSRYDLNSPEYEFAKEEIKRLSAKCGPGVFRGVVGKSGRPAKNRCRFQVELDELFFTPPELKTGFLPDPHWPYQDGVSFLEANPRSVPDNFDLRDLMKNGQPEIRKQMCGDCWAWSTHHGLEIARAVHDQKVFDYSVQTILSCSKAGTCNGGYMSAVNFLTKGLPFEEDFPYAASDKKCKYTTSELQSGWEPKVIATPYVGNSLRYSLENRLSHGGFREGTKVLEMMKAMYQWKAPLVVTVAAYDLTGAGVYDSCSAINSGGNHMVAISGWEMWNGKRVAHVWNSWGPGHGEKGVSRIVWECGDGRLNRGLGVSAKIVQYKPTCVPPDASQKYLHESTLGQPVVIGAKQPEGTKCAWTPTSGLSDPTSCLTTAAPSVSTEYHLTAENNCGKSSSMTLVYLWKTDGQRPSEKVLTPFGEISYSHKQRSP